MKIVLMCREPHGEVALKAETIEGIEVPKRIYDIADHRITLSGFATAVLHHDAQAMLAYPGGMVRMPTPQEQFLIAEADRQARTISEVA